MVYATTHRMTLSHPMSNAIAVLLRSYTRAINIQEGRTGSLFQQKTKAKCLNPPLRVWKNFPTNADNYAFICLNYIHQNPMVAGLAKKMEDWEFSSFRDYACMRSQTLCNKKRTFELIPYFEESNFYELSYQLIAANNMNDIL